MSTKKVQTTPVEFAWEEVARSLFVAQGITSGLWHLAVKVNFAATTVKTEPGSPDGMPTGMVGMVGLALIPAPEPGLMVFDASTLTRRPRLSKAAASPSTRKTVGSKRLGFKKAAPKA